MSDITPRLSLPVIRPAQAQKHIPHNEALLQLDSIVQLRITELNSLTPPEAPEEGSIYAVGDTPTGTWINQTGNLAVASGSGWLFITPHHGWLAWDETGDQLVSFSNGSWESSVVNPQTLEHLGIATTADSHNRLVVASPATLFTHSGTGGHQLKINKADNADTGSLLFQSNWTGHAEIGLTGSTKFSLKLSENGTDWLTALSADSNSVEIALPIGGLAVQQSAHDTTSGRLMRADWGYSPGNILGTVSEISGQPSGALIEHSETPGGHYSRWADGTQICWARLILSYIDATQLAADWSFPAPFSGAPVISACYHHTGSVTLPARALTGPAISSLSGVPETDQARVSLFSIEGSAGFQSADTATIMLSAIGRWF